MLKKGDLIICNGKGRSDGQISWWGRCVSCDLEAGNVYRYVSIGKHVLDLDFLVISSTGYNARCLVLRKGRRDIDITGVDGLVTLMVAGDEYRVRHLLPPEEWSDEICAAVAKYRLCEGS